MLSRTSKALRKELIEAFTIVEALESLSLHRLPSVLLDLCSGKGFLSVILAFEFNAAQVVMVDSNKDIKLGRHLRWNRAPSPPSVGVCHSDLSTPP